MRFTIKQAAQYIDNHESNIRRLLRTGEIKGEKTGTKPEWIILKKDLDKYLKKKNPTQGYLKAKELAQMCKLHKMVILKSIKDQELPARKKNGAWEIKKQDAHKYIKGRKTPQGYMTLIETAKELGVNPPVIHQTLKKHQIATEKKGREVIISTSNIQKLKEILNTATPGRKPQIASIYFRKFGHRNNSGISGPFLEARSGTYQYGRIILGQIPLSNTKPETILKAKNKLIKKIQNQGITDIRDKIKN